MTAPPAVPWKTFAARHLGLGPILLVLTIREHQRGGQRVLEAFLLAPRLPEHTFRGCRFGIGPGVTPDDRELLETVDPVNIGRDWARDEMENDLRAWYERQPVGTPYPDPIEFTEVPGNAIAEAWLRGQLRDEILRIRSETRCRELQDHIYRLSEVPPINQGPTGA